MGILHLRLLSFGIPIVYHTLVIDRQHLVLILTTTAAVRSWDTLLDIGFKIDSNVSRNISHHVEEHLIMSIEIAQ
jgi:hypothetical protein